MSVLERFRLDGRVAIVTGAGKGIGAAIARALAEAGADVALLARTVADLESVAEQVRAYGRRALVLPADMNDLGTLTPALDAVVGILGGVHILVNNAGGSLPKPLLEATPEAMAAAYHFNVITAVELSRLAVPHLLASGPGSCILNISSMAGVLASRGSLTYGSAKSALSTATRHMAADLAPDIRVNAVLPGAVETESLRGWLETKGPAVRTMLEQRALVHRIGTPDDIAAAALYLCSDAASWVTGKLLEVDGGYSISA